jgi:uncharacterized membrane protein YtjA (UPF0391 family)
VVVNVHLLNGRGLIMLYWSLMFFVFAVIAGILGFGGLAAGAAGMAQILFYVFIFALIISVLANAVRGRRPPI